MVLNVKTSGTGVMSKHCCQTLLTVIKEGASQPPKGAYHRKDQNHPCWVARLAVREGPKAKGAMLGAEPPKELLLPRQVTGL